MKTRIFISAIIIFLTSFFANAQEKNEVIVGKIENGNVSITKENAFLQYFNNSLKNDGTLGALQTVINPDGKHIYIGCPVTSSSKNTTSIGIITLISNNSIYLLNENSSMASGPGGSAEVTCTGAPCNACWVKSLGVAPYFQCDCSQNNPPCSNCICNMTITAKVEIGLF